MPPTSASQEAAEKALRERAQLNQAYRRAKSAHRHQLYQQYPRLHQFGLQLNRFQAPHAAAFLTFVREENRSWLCTAPPEVRFEALSLVDERIQRIRMNAGLLPMDDPLPEQDDDVWQLAKRELA